MLQLSTFAVKREDNEIKRLWEDCDDCICICDFQAARDINAVLEIATMSGARGVVVATKPNAPSSSLPVLLVSNVALTKLSCRSDSIVWFQHFSVNATMTEEMTALQILRTME
jgi:hypothetical protein